MTFADTSLEGGSSNRIRIDESEEKLILAVNITLLRFYPIILTSLLQLSLRNNRQLAISFAS
jgi:hypothetical protein